MCSPSRCNQGSANSLAPSSEQTFTQFVRAAPGKLANYAQGPQRHFTLLLPHNPSTCQHLIIAYKSGMLLNGHQLFTGANRGLAITNQITETKRGGEGE